MSGRFVSKPVEIEAMQWAGDNPGSDPEHDRKIAERIVAWVNANGGEARYEEAWEGLLSQEDARPARIMVRTNSGWAPVRPGWWIVKGSELFEVYDDRPAIRRVLDHYPCEPDTFDKRWERVA